MAKVMGNYVLSTKLSTLHPPLPGYHHPSKLMIKIFFVIWFLF